VKGRGHGAVTARRGYGAVTARARRGAVMAQSRRGHGAARSWRGHGAVTARARRGIPQNLPVRSWASRPSTSSSNLLCTRGQRSIMFMQFYYALYMPGPAAYTPCYLCHACTRSRGRRVLAHSHF
jgi:hypothetical protein